MLLRLYAIYILYFTCKLTISCSVERLKASLRLFRPIHGCNLEWDMSV